MKKNALIILATLLLSGTCYAQAVSQSGQITPGHVPIWATNGVIKDGGTAANPAATSFGVMAGQICANSGPITGPYNAFCLQSTQTGGGVLSVYNYNGATGGFSFNLNGVTQSFPVVGTPTVANDAVCFLNTAGSLTDCNYGTGVATALGINVGTAGSVVVNGGAGGTPSSLTLTNATGLPTTGLTGTLQAAQFPALTGYATSAGGALATTVVKVKGTTTNDNATAGDVGEIIVSDIPTASAVPITTTTATDITSVSLTAGDWDCTGDVVTKPAAGTVTTQLFSWTNTTSASLPAALETQGFSGFSGTTGGSQAIAFPAQPWRYSLAGTTTVYLSTYINFSVSTMGAYGYMRCRRIR